MKGKSFLIWIVVAACLVKAAIVMGQDEPPRMDALIDLEKQAAAAWGRGDARFFEGILSDNFISRDGQKRTGKTAILKVLAGQKCDVRNIALDEPSLTRISSDTYVLIYRETADGTCIQAGGQVVNIPSPSRTATVWVRSAGKWLAAFHGVNPIVDPKDAPMVPRAETVTARGPDATTAALAAMETSAWEGWRAHDRKKIEAITADSVAFIDIFGNAYAKRADIIDAWSSSICKVTSVAVTDPVSFSMSPTVKLLTHIGTANGTCYGAKIGPIYGNSLYVKDGKGWKLAFTMNMPAM